ncbi:MAG: SEC-C domain-containing protein [Planctomycetes bacterium]|nr:SEC-C domain-containing protein [Planctomycetota bacterium]MBL7043173.1 SEC-C domain-containing protein [Pirellulaceae bacterium]
MEVLGRIWEVIGVFFGGLLKGFERAVTTVFGSSNTRYIKRLQARVEAINALEPKFEALTDAELKEQTDRFRQRLRAGETLEDLLIEAFAVCREAGRRFLNMRHYDVQLIGGMVLHSGAIAEMVTGEGKTLVATLAAYLNALEGKGVHCVTVNDYLARRDMEWMGPLYLGLGLTVGTIQSDMAVLDRQKAYSCDITYGTNNEFGFDYLRDNMRPAARGDERFEKRMQQSQGRLHYAIVDEVDNILIDEARTPLIISGPAYDDVRKYSEADRISRQLKKGSHFVVNEKDHTAHLTDEGVREAERLAGVESFYTAGNMDWPHLLDNSLKAHYLYQKDVRYVIKEGRIIIVDEFTGRLMEGRQWSDGLHQAVEAKEGVKIKEETQTLATITLQNFFKLYDKISGMTGTAMTEASEFWKIYELEVVAIPTNRPLRRFVHPDVIYRTETEKYRAVADEVERVNRWDVLAMEDGSIRSGTILKEHEDSVDFQPKDGKKKENVSLADIREIERKGRPMLIGTVSIEKSERLSSLLDKRGVKHQVLNAKHHKREADIVAQAGRFAAVTIATNMAGRGTDIVLGGNPETMAWAQLQDKYETRLDVPRDEWDGLIAQIAQEEKMDEEGEHVKSIGGLHVMATERHEARRIDLQLRGRCGRQGDPGSSRFFLSLEDDLMRIFAGEWVKRILETLGMKEGEAIESRMVTRRIEAAQKKVEERHFEGRKHLLEYDEVMDEQRKRVYGYRQTILDGGNCRQMIVDAVREQADHHLGTYMERDFGVGTFAKWAGKRLATELEGRDFRGMDIEQATHYAKDEAERFAETQVIDAIEENLPDVDEDEKATAEWNWQALAKFGNSRWGLNLRDRELKKVGRDGVAELIIERAREAIQRIDLSDGAPPLQDDFGLHSAIGWVRHKFGIELDFEEVRELEPEELRQLVCERAEEAYDDKEAEYPVMASLYRFASGAGHSRLDRESLAAWAQHRFATNLSIEDFKHKQREEIRALLVDHSRACQQRANEVMKEVQQKIDRVFGPESEGQTAGIATEGEGALASLSDWLKETLDWDMSVEDMERLERDELEQKLTEAVQERYRPEMRRMERTLLLQIVDAAWKDHLLAMDHLRSSIGLAGYAQMDPKVEYKREGMRLFEGMWDSIHERVTDLVFRMEQLDEGLVGSTWVETSATHAEAQSASEIAQQQQAAIDASKGDGAVETIRRRGPRVGRNEPCPCKSGKKYKNCCMRKMGAA